MKRLVYTKPNRPLKLHDELVAAVPGLRLPGEDPSVPFMGFNSDGQTVTLTVADEIDEPAVAAVVAAHDPTTPGPSEVLRQQTEANEQTLRERADQAVGTLQNAWDNWGSLTNAQKDAALKLTVRVVIALARLTLRKLDSA